MLTSQEHTRWRELAKPLDPRDPIVPDGPRYEEGKLPVGFVLLLWDGTSLIGPMQFLVAIEAENFLKAHPKVTHYIIIPKPQ